MIKDQDFNCPEIHNGLKETFGNKSFFAVLNITNNSSCGHFCSDLPVSDATLEVHGDWCSGHIFVVS